MTQRRPSARRNTSGGDDSSDDQEPNALGSADPDYAKLYTPGDIHVSSREHRRLIEATDNADNPRVEFVGEAAAMGPPEERDGGGDQEVSDGGE